MQFDKRGRGYPDMIGRAIVMAAAFAFAAGSALADEPLTLRFAVPGAGPASATYTGVMQPWATRAEADSDGSLKFQVNFTIANLGNVFDRVVNNVADVGYMVMGTLGAKFAGSGVVELPSDIAGSREGAGAFWRIYQDGLVAAEWAEVRPLALFVFPQNVLSSPKPLTSLADVKGMRVATLSKGGGDIVDRLGGAAISANPGTVYEHLQRRTAEAVIIGWLGVTGFKLTDVTNYHLELGLDSGGGAVVMSKDAYTKLPGKVKQAIDRNSGAAASLAIGAAFDRVYADAENSVRGLPDHTIVPATQAEKERYLRLVGQPLTEDWVKRTPNGAAILAAYRAEAARLRQTK
jgi:TRAP-type C4-dicarboxylate transport system substrate-binding protein